MDLSKPLIVPAQVMHKRINPKKNRFNYSVYYLAIPLETIEDQSLNEIIKLNKFGFNSFHEHEHGFKGKKPLREWVNTIHNQHGAANPHTVTLICMPKVLGYVFNPVSFWLCFNEAKELCSVIYEVNNTFGESHSYFCENKGQKILHNNWLVAVKNFHVSPFFKVSGYYKFCINTINKLDIRINYFENEELKLCTRLSGTPKTLTRKNLACASIKNPLVPLKVMFLIHFQALRLVIKKICYIKKPEPPQELSSRNQI